MKLKSSRQTIAVLLGLFLVLAITNAVLYFALLFRNKGEIVMPAFASDAASTGETSEDSDSGVATSSATSEASKVSVSSDAATDERSSEKYQYGYQNFTADLQAYEEYMNPGTDAYLFLVNADNPLGSGDNPSDLINVVNTRDDGRDAQQMRLYAEKALEALFIEAKEQGMLYNNNGYRLSVTSAYRSYASQKWIFNNYVDETMAANPSLSREEAEELVISYSSRPGTSEHQTGLCCDMHNFAAASSSNGMREQFANSQAGIWLTANCAKFGFILRYPDGKQDKMCGVGYESWHFRYVGRYHAVKIMESGLCLEEYMETLQ